MGEALMCCRWGSSFFFTGILLLSSGPMVAGVVRLTARGRGETVVGGPSPDPQRCERGWLRSIGSALNFKGMGDS